MSSIALLYLEKEALWAYLSSSVICLFCRRGPENSFEGQENSFVKICETPRRRRDRFDVHGCPQFCCLVITVFGGHGMRLDYSRLSLHLIQSSIWSGVSNLQRWSPSSWWWIAWRQLRLHPNRLVSSKAIQRLYLTSWEHSFCRLQKQAWKIRIFRIVFKLFRTLRQQNQEWVYKRRKRSCVHFTLQVSKDPTSDYRRLHRVFAYQKKSKKVRRGASQKDFFALWHGRTKRAAGCDILGWHGLRWPSRLLWVWERGKWWWWGEHGKGWTRYKESSKKLCSADYELLRWVFS